MFTVDLNNKRVVIAHKVQALDGAVNLTTTLDLVDVPEEKVLQWAATNRLTRWLDSMEIGKLSIAEVKDRFDHLVIEYKDYFRSNSRPISPDEKKAVDNLLQLMREGSTMEKQLQFLINYTRRLGKG